MNALGIAAVALLLASCAAPARDDPVREATRTAADLADEGWTRVELLGGGDLDLARSFAADRSVALVFWQTWCQACLREGPAVAAAAKRLSGSVDFVGVVTGPDDVVDEPEVERTAAKLGLPYPQARDRSAALARRFGVKGTPTIVVIEPTGSVSYSGHELPPSWGTK